MRAPQGLLLSTTARAGSYGSAQGTQMDSQEALAQLRGARDLGQRLSEASTPAGAAVLKSVEPEHAVHTAVQDLDPAARGKFPGTVDGQSGLQDASGRSPADPVPRPARPYVLLDTPSRLAHATQGDVMRLSGLSMSRITQGDQHDTAAHTAVHVAGQQVSLHSHQGQLQVKAAAGPVSIQAHTDALEILADQSVQILSVNDRITISAKDRIEIVAGDSKVTLKGGDVEFATPGTFEVKSATHNFLGGGSGSASLAALPQGKSSEQVIGEMQALTPSLAPPATNTPLPSLKTFFSEAVDYSEFADDWLPWAARASGHAHQDALKLAGLPRAHRADYAAGLVTEAAQAVQHWRRHGSGWRVEQVLDLPADADSEPELDGQEDDEQ